MALLGPLGRPAAARWGRPTARNAVKGSLAAYGIACERLAELGEKVQDLVAEARIEQATERMRARGPAVPEHGP